MNDNPKYGTSPVSGVVELDPSDPKATVCGHCGRGWDDSISTAITPVPAGRCPFEYQHVYEEEPAPSIGKTDEDLLKSYEELERVPTDEWSPDHEGAWNLLTEDMTKRFAAILKSNVHPE